MKSHRNRVGCWSIEWSVLRYTEQGHQFPIFLLNNVSVESKETILSQRRRLIYLFYQHIRRVIWYTFVDSECKTSSKKIHCMCRQDSACRGKPGFVGRHGHGLNTSKVKQKALFLVNELPLLSTKVWCDKNPTRL